MPVFFYIDPDFGEDPRMENIETITLSYTFFEAKEGAHLVLPNAHANAKNGWCLLLFPCTGILYIAAVDSK